VDMHGQLARRMSACGRSQRPVPVNSCDYCSAAEWSMVCGHSLKQGLCLSNCPLTLITPRRARTSSTSLRAPCKAACPGLYQLSPQLSLSCPPLLLARSATSTPEIGHYA